MEDESPEMECLRDPDGKWHVIKEYERNASRAICGAAIVGTETRILDLRVTPDFKLCADCETTLWLNFGP